MSRGLIGLLTATTLTASLSLATVGQAGPTFLESPQAGGHLGSIAPHALMTSAPARVMTLPTHAIESAMCVPDGGRQETCLTLSVLTYEPTDAGVVDGSAVVEFRARQMPIPVVVCVQESLQKIGEMLVGEHP